MIVVAAVIERRDRRILIGQRRRGDTSPLKWEFPGGKIEAEEEPEGALARELRGGVGGDVTALRGDGAGAACLCEQCEPNRDSVLRGGNCGRKYSAKVL